MKKFALKSVATVVGVGLSGVAAAQVNLDDSKASDAYKYASETTVGTSKDLGSNLKASMKVGVAFNKDTTAYVRYDLSKGTFKSNPTLDCGAGTTVTSAVTGGTTNLAVFAIVNSATGIASTDTCTLTAADLTVTAQDAIDLQGRVFETLTNALNPSASNSLNTKSKALVSWTPAVSITFDAGTKATATVANSYKQFGSSKDATLGSVKVAETGALLTTGTAAKFTDIVASSSVSVAGDFSFVKDKTATSLGGVAASSLTGTTAATFTSAIATGTNSLAVSATGDKAIVAGSYTATVSLTAKSGFAISNPAAASVGQIVRDGNQLLIPLAQNATALGGYVSRFSLVNRGTADAAYTVTIIQEDGSTATLASSAASGTVKANSTKVVDLTGAAGSGALQGRGALLVTVEAAANTISGTYQITNLSSGAVSNQTMVVVSN
jgi:hypothetical protein